MDCDLPVDGLAPFRFLVAQPVEHPPVVRKSMGSNPIGTRTFSELMYVSVISFKITHPHSATAAIPETYLGLVEPAEGRSQSIYNLQELS